MKKERVENFLASLETNGMLTDKQQSLIMQSELDSFGCGENVECENFSLAACGGEDVFNSKCINSGSKCAGNANYKCSNLEVPNKQQCLKPSLNPSCG